MNPLSDALRFIAVLLIVGVTVLLAWWDMRGPAITTALAGTCIILSRIVEEDV